MTNSHGNMSRFENEATGSVGQPQSTHENFTGFIDTPPDPPNPLGDDTLLNDYVEWRIRDGRNGWFMAGFGAGMEASTEKAQRMLELANQKVEAARKEMAAAERHMAEARQQMAEANQRMEEANQNQAEYESDDYEEEEFEDQESNDQNTDEDDEHEDNGNAERRDNNDRGEEQEDDDDDDSQYTVSEIFELLPQSRRQPTTGGKTVPKSYSHSETGRKKPVTYAEQGDVDDEEEEEEEVSEEDDDDDYSEYNVSKTSSHPHQSRRRPATSGKTGSRSYNHSETGRKQPVTYAERDDVDDGEEEEENEEEEDDDDDDDSEYTASKTFNRPRQSRRRPTTVGKTESKSDTRSGPGRQKSLTPGNRPTTARQLIAVTAQTTTSSNPTAGSSRGRDRQIPWTDDERRLVGQYMKEIVAANIVKGEAKFAEIANRITATTGIHRTWNSVKNYWNRDGRKAHGFDERIHRRVPFMQTGVRDKNKRERIPDAEEPKKTRGKVAVKEEPEEEDDGRKEGKEEAEKVGEGEVEEEEWEGWDLSEESGKESDEKRERVENEHLDEYGHGQATETGEEEQEEHDTENEDDNEEQYEGGDEDEDDYEEQNDDNNDDNNDDDDDDYYEQQSSRRLDGGMPTSRHGLTSRPQSPIRSPSAHLREGFTAQKRKRPEDDDDDDYFGQPFKKVLR